MKTSNFKSNFKHLYFLIKEEDEDEGDEQGEEEPQEEDDEVEPTDKKRASGKQTEPEDVSKQSTATKKEGCGDKATPPTQKAEAPPSIPDTQAAPSNPDPKASDVGSNAGELAKKESGKESNTTGPQVEESMNKQQQAPAATEATAAKAPTSQGSRPAQSILALVFKKIYLFCSRCH